MRLWPEKTVKLYVFRTLELIVQNLLQVAFFLTSVGHCENHAQQLKKKRN